MSCGAKSATPIFPKASGDVSNAAPDQSLSRYAGSAELWSAERARFCRKCGAPLLAPVEQSGRPENRPATNPSPVNRQFSAFSPAQSPLCSRCGSYVPAGVRYCPACGMNQMPPKPPEQGSDEISKTKEPLSNDAIPALDSECTDIAGR